MTWIAWLVAAILFFPFLFAVGIVLVALFQRWEWIKDWD